MKSKLTHIQVILSALFLYLIFIGFSFNPPDGHTGAPGDNGTCENCHFQNNPAPNGSVSISGLPNTVMPGASHTITVTSSNPNGLAQSAGFQLVAIDGNGQNIGTLSNPSANTTVTSFNGRNYFEHNPASSFTGTTVSWSVTWTAPNTAGSQVQMFAASVIADGMSGNGGDLVVTTATSGTIENPVDPLTVSIMNVQDISCNGANDGQATAVPMGGQMPYSFSWSNGATSATVSNLGPGGHSVQVTDGNGETATAMVTINEPAVLFASASATAESAAGANDGTAISVPSGGTPPYSFMWSNGSTNQMLTGLAPGDYTVVVTDDNGCTAMQTVTVNSGNVVCDLTVSVTAIDVLCNGDGNGEAMAMPSGGTAPFTFMWSNSAGTQNISGLDGGTYSVTVMDANDCMATASGDVFEPQPLFANAFATGESVSGANDGSATADPSGGTPPYDFSWSNGGFGESIFGLAPGDYTVTITDDNGCTTTQTVTVTGGDVVCDISVSVSTTDVNCNGDNDGTATADVSGGTAPFTFMWSNGATSQTITGLSAGSYSVTVMDANDCPASAGAGVSEPSALVLNASATGESSAGTNDGSATASASGGTSPYSFAWSNGQSGTSISGLAPGNYTVTVTDDNGCTTTQSVTVTEGGVSCDISASVTTSDASCNGASDGFAMVDVTGGTMPFTYNWSNNVTTPSNMNIGAGTYSVIVTDADGCTATATGSVGQPSAVSANASASNESSAGANDGSATANPSGGTAPYTFAWSNGGNTSTITGLAPGSYTVTVTDANNCTASQTVMVNSGGVSCDVSVTVSTQNTACGSDDGEATASVSGGTAPFSYTWSNGGNTATISGLGAGTYTVTVVDAMGCMATSSGVINSAGNISCNITITNTISEQGANDGALEASATGSGPFTYLWSNGETTAEISGLGAGTYSVTVTNNEGCSCTSSAELTEPMDPGDGVMVGNFVWLDQNRNGLQDMGETGVGGIQLYLASPGPDNTLCTPDDVIEGVTETNGGGFYHFDGLGTGLYVIVVDLNSLGDNREITAKDVGMNDEIDSDADRLTGILDPFMVIEGQMPVLSFDVGISLICDNFTDGGEIAGDEVLCGSGLEASPIVSLSLPSGGFGDIEYMWFKREQGSAVWDLIPGANEPEYDPGVIFETTLFIRCARRVGCTPFLETNFVTKQVAPIPPAIIMDSPNSLCINEGGTFAALWMPDIEYHWDFGDGATPATGSEAIVENVRWNMAGLKTVSLTTIGENGCSMTTTVQVSVSNCMDNLVSDTVEGIGTTSNPNGNHSSDFDMASSNVPNISVQFYPNPVENKAWLDIQHSEQVQAQVEVYNTFGQLMFRKVVPTGTREALDFSNLESGLYWLNIDFGYGKNKMILVNKAGL